jgi:predicted nucleic acid-binding protein
MGRPERFRRDGANAAPVARCVRRLDPNVLVSAPISSAGPPREIVEAWALGRFELVASPALLGELGDVLATSTAG